MSRSGYSEDCDGGALNLWRGAVERSIQGKRGQAFLREALAALDAMPDKKLTTDTLHEPATGEFCVLGVVGAARDLDLASLKYAEREGVAKAFGIAPALAAEIMYTNDEDWHQTSTPERRWSYMRNWIASNIRVAA